MGKTKTNKNPLQHSLEAIQGYSTDAAKTVAKGTANEASAFASDFFSDLMTFGLGSSSAESSKENHGKGEVELFSAESHKKGEKAHKPEIRAHIDYHGEILHSSERANNKENRELTQKLQEALAEIQNLIKSSKGLEMEFGNFIVEEAPKQVGEYHLSFLDWLIITIQQARMKVEDSGAWLSTVKGKNGKKGGFINDMWKKGNTSVTMSNERNVATSVG